MVTTKKPVWRLSMSKPYFIITLLNHLKMIMIHSVDNHPVLLFISSGNNCLSIEAQL